MERCKKRRRPLVSLAACLLGVAPVLALLIGLSGPSMAALPAPTTGPSRVEAGSVVINEVAWMGTAASHAHEWIELFNNTDQDIDLAGWSLVAADGTPNIQLSGVIAAQAFFLLQRTGDHTVSDIPADLIYTGALQNDPDAEVLVLYSDIGQVIDTANWGGGPWPAGDNTTKQTMERIDPLAPDTPDNWCSNDGITRNGKDANGDPINGTPRAPNSCYRPPALPVADLRVTKDGPNTARPGDLITYHIVVENLGTAPASGVILTDALPSAVALVTQTSPCSFTSLHRLLQWECGDMSVGMTRGITLAGRVSDIASAPIVNVVTATITGASVFVSDSAVHTTTIRAQATVYLPLLVRDYAPPRYGVIIEAVLYDGLQRYDYDEAVLVLNGYHVDVDLTGWRLCTWHAEDWRCAGLPAADIGPGQRLWLARNAEYFARSFGFAPDHVLSSWPRFANAGGEVALLDADDAVRDLLVYRDGRTDLQGWLGSAVEPYRGANFALRGQVLYRVLDEVTGLPAADTDTAADWAQYPGDPVHGRRVRYPGWELERFFQPAVGASGTVTAAIAPDNAYQLVVDTIRSARETIEIQAYSLRHYQLTRELVDRAQQGVTVTVLLEGGPVGGLQDQQLWACQQLHATGSATCTFMVNVPDQNVRSRYRYLHAKAMIVDRKRLLVSSQNFNHGGLPGDDKGNGTGGSRGVVLVTDSPPMVARAAEVFDADHDPDNHTDLTLWAYDNELGYGPPPADFSPDVGQDWITYTVRFSETMVAQATWFELMTAPEAALRTSDGLLGLVTRAGAGDAVYVQQLYERPHWGDPAHGPNLRLQAYVEAARRGARVRILLNGGSFDLDYLPLTAEAEAVAAVNAIAESEGLDMSARLGDPTDYGIHNKMVLVDLGARGQYAHVGSINGSETSNKVNRELALQVESPDLFHYLHTVFVHDWEHEVPYEPFLSGEAARRAGGDGNGGGGSDRRAAAAGAGSTAISAPWWRFPNEPPTSSPL